MTPAPTLQDLITTVRSDAGSDDPLELLSTAVGVATDLDTVKDELLGYFVDRCRGSGKSWTEISAALGVTRQAAHRRFNVSSPPLDRFTDRTRRVIEAAPSRARELGHDYVGTEHLLLALFTESQSIATRILRERGVDAPSVEAAVIVVSPRGTTAPDEPIAYNPRGATALTGAVTSAIELGHNYVGTEHLLLALLRDPDSLAAKILGAFGLHRDDVLPRIRELLDTAAPSQPPTGPATAGGPSLVARGVVPDGFLRFTAKGSDVVVRAQEEARTLQHAYLGTEHLLLGLFDDESSAAARVLDAIGVSKSGVRDEIVNLTGVGPSPVHGAIPFTPRGRDRLERALVEADERGDEKVGPEHILLALVDGDDPGIAAQILAEHDGTRARIAELVQAALDADDR